MPFFYLGGNHDLGNDTMTQVWLEMSDRQMEYTKKVSADNPNVRWTFVLFHQPEWQETPGKAFQAIEQMIRSRPYTFIAGHLHYSDYAHRNDRDYITKGQVGASWQKMVRVMLIIYSE
jgi:hypothetical protein